MRCKDFECLIIDSSESKLSQEERLALEQHISRCAACARFQEDLKNIRIRLKSSHLPGPSAELAEKTRLMCHAEMSSKHAMDSQLIPQSLRPSIPRFIWAALISLTVLTAILLIPLFRHLSLDQTLSFKATAGFALMMQNIVMLIFAPIVLRRYSSQQKNLRFI